MKHIEKAVDYKQLDISSSAFSAQGMIPAKYTCDGENVNPPLDIEHIPEEAKCLALIVDDPDAPVNTWGTLAGLEYTCNTSHKRKQSTRNRRPQRFSATALQRALPTFRHASLFF